MARVRTILRPAVKSKNFTYEEALAAWREVKRERERQTAKKARAKSKSAAKAG